MGRLIHAVIPPGYAARANLVLTVIARIWASVKDPRSGEPTVTAGSEDDDLAAGSILVRPARCVFLAFEKVEIDQHLLRGGQAGER